MALLRLFTLLGFTLVGLAAVALPIYIILYIIGGAPAGITTLIVIGILGIGINRLGIGILGEYLGRTYAETKRRPLYVIAESVNFGERQVHTVPDAREEIGVDAQGV